MNFKKKGLAVDIDETLSNTVLHFMEQLQKKFGNPENLSAKEMVEKYRYARNVPYWQNEKVSEWAEEARQNNELQEQLPLIEGSNKKLNEINKIIPIVAYLTIRPQNIATGTEKFLKKHGFPKAEIIFRPENISFQDGNKWKAKILEESYPDILGIIDDNPEVIENISKDYLGIIFLYNKDSYETENKNIIPCKTWEDVLQKIKNTLA